jgi:tumor protein p53-inducible protein 3
VRAVILKEEGGPEKLDFCRRLGASTTINYREEVFADRVLTATAGQGVNIIIDFIGGPYWAQNVRALAVDGRFVVLATMGGGHVGNFDLRDLFKKRACLMTSTLRTRSLEYKALLNSEFSRYAPSRFNNGRLRPVIDRIFDWQDVAAAHRYMEENRNTGKIILRIVDEGGSSYAD